MKNHQEFETGKKYHVIDESLPDFEVLSSRNSFGYKEFKIKYNDGIGFPIWVVGLRMPVSEEIKKFKKVKTIIQQTTQKTSRPKIKTMKCRHCGSSKAMFYLEYKGNTFDADKKGIVGCSYSPKFPRSTNLLDQPKNVLKSLRIIAGQCGGKCEDESSLDIEFEDGSHFHSDEKGAFEYLTK